MLDLEWNLINLVQYFDQENYFYFILKAYLEIFKPCGYFLRNKKKLRENQGSLRLFREVSGHSGKIFDSKSGTSVTCSVVKFQFAKKRYIM